MDYNIHKICRVCLEEGTPGPLTSIYSTDFAMMPSVMLMQCAKIRVCFKKKQTKPNYK